MKSSNTLLSLSKTWNKSWLPHLAEELKQDYMLKLNAFLQNEIQQDKQILPTQENWFNTLNNISLNDVKVVILGQDPYPTPGHAHGLCFSVLPDVKPLPKSLINIYKELKSDINITNENGCLSKWADQGVLLLNSVLTVESGQANAHQGKGWEQFTDKIISVINDQERSVVFVLWGAYAQKKGNLIDEQKHLVIRSPHPSPLSAYRGFYGSKPFTKINNYLQEQEQTEIDWET